MRCAQCPPLAINLPTTIILPPASVVQVVGYMGVPYYNTDMVKHPQYITVRNSRGQEMMDSVKGKLEIIPTMSSGDRKPFVLQTVIADDE